MRLPFSSTWSTNAATLCWQIFGPSGHKTSPSEGVINGYTCRLKKLERVKSLVRLGGMAASICNVVHWFILEEGYREYKISEREAVVNHYKYQVRSGTVVDFATSKGHVSLQPRGRKHGWKSGSGARAGLSSRVRPQNCDGGKQPRGA